MNYTLIEERHVHAARIAHRCIWCDEQIPAGSPYIYERSIFDGVPQSHHWHAECLGAMHDLARAEGGETTWDPHNNERPSGGSAGDA